MIGPNCLVIDDVAAALNSLTEFGREIVAAGASLVRDRVFEFLDRRRWTALPYAQYATWARDQMMARDLCWYVLDPILPLADLPSQPRRAKVLRSGDGRGFRLDDGFALARHDERSQAIGVVDDAAATGGTLLTLASGLTDDGSRIAAFALGVSTTNARARVTRVHSGTRYSVFQHGEWNVCHLRDGIPHLPFVGRRTAHPNLRVGDRSVIEVRRSMVHATNNLWQVLLIDPGIREAVRRARAMAEEGLTRHLGRPPVVADITLLGPEVPIVFEGETPPGADTRLADLI